MDVVHGDMLEPCSGAFHEVEWQVLDDEEIIVCPACSTSEAEILQPYSGVGVPRVLDDVRRHAETHREQRLSDLLRKRLQAKSVQAWTASNISDPGVSTMVVWVTVIVVW